MNIALNVESTQRLNTLSQQSTIFGEEIPAHQSSDSDSTWRSSTRSDFMDGGTV